MFNKSIFLFYFTLNCFQCFEKMELFSDSRTYISQYSPKLVISNQALKKDYYWLDSRDGIDECQESFGTAGNAQSA